jgi:hypothetical protein
MPTRIWFTNQNHVDVKGHISKVLPRLLSDDKLSWALRDVDDRTDVWINVANVTAVRHQDGPLDEEPGGVLWQQSKI